MTYLSIRFVGGIQITGTCNGTYSNKPKEITSPRFPDDYTSNEACEWDIEAPRGKRIELLFLSFRTEARHDYLRIYDGRSNKSSQILEHSGFATPSNTHSSGNRLHLVWKSDVNREESGFKIEVRAVWLYDGKFDFITFKYKIINI